MSVVSEAPMASSNVQRINDLGRIIQPSGDASILTSDEAVADAVRIQAIDTAGGVTVASGTGGVTTTSTGPLASTTTSTLTTAVNLQATNGGIKLKSGLGLYTPISTVTQATSKTTGVTINADAGVITTVSLTDAADTSFLFTVTNSRVIAGTSIVLLTPVRANLTQGKALVEIGSVGAGSFDIIVTNVGTAAFNDTLRIQFLVLNHDA